MLSDFELWKARERENKYCYMVFKMFEQKAYFIIVLSQKTQQGCLDENALVLLLVPLNTFRWLVIY